MRAEERTLVGGADTAFEAHFNTLVEVFLDGFLKDEKETDKPGAKRKKMRIRTRKE